MPHLALLEFLLLKKASPAVLFRGKNRSLNIGLQDIQHNFSTKGKGPGNPSLVFVMGFPSLVWLAQPLIHMSITCSAVSETAHICNQSLFHLLIISKHFFQILLATLFFKSLVEWLKILGL